MLSYAKVQTWVGWLLRGRRFQLRRARVRDLRHLDLGCGRNTHRELINMDYLWHPAIDLCWDVTRGLPLRFLGFAGHGHQVRDFLHPWDLVPLLRAQMGRAAETREPIVNLGGGIGNSFSLAQLSEWCSERFVPRPVARDPETRRQDAPWIVMDSRRAERLWIWRAATPLKRILEEIANYSDAHPEWLELS